MTKQEFEELTGWEVSQEEYAEYDAMYLASGDLDKRDFCADLKKHKGSKIIKELVAECHRRQMREYDAIRDAQRLQKENDELRGKMAEMLVEKAYQTGSNADRVAAIVCCGGVREYLLKKMDMRCTPLTDEDMKDVREILKAM